MGACFPISKTFNLLPTDGWAHCHMHGFHTYRNINARANTRQLYIRCTFFTQLTQQKRESKASQNGKGNRCVRRFGFEFLLATRPRARTHARNETKRFPGWTCLLTSDSSGEDGRTIASCNRHNKLRGPLWVCVTIYLIKAFPIFPPPHGVPRKEMGVCTRFKAILYSCSDVARRSASTAKCKNRNGIQHVNAKRSYATWGGQKQRIATPSNKTIPLQKDKATTLKSQMVNYAKKCQIILLQEQNRSGP